MLNTWKINSNVENFISFFIFQVEDAYVACGKTLQEKLPICNVFLKAVSAIHPDSRGHSLSLGYLAKLPGLVTNVLADDEIDKYDLEVRKFQTDTIPDIEEGERIDVWWGKKEIQLKYPCLTKMVRSILSCFHGPQVESSFNIMNDVIDSKSGRINIDTYNSIQNVKYSLKSADKSAVEYFKKKDYLHEKVDASLCANLRSSCRQYKAALATKKEQSEERKRTLNIVISRDKVLTKRKAKELFAKAAKKSKLCHSESANKAKQRVK